ncbi:hypothetical protein ZWY2020_031627 [Hordeum vulgare]|nr:hypothetical protein ZWY2020_031627 [Hordeum vulgare]
MHTSPIGRPARAHVVHDRDQPVATGLPEPISRPDTAATTPPPDSQQPPSPPAARAAWIQTRQLADGIRTGRETADAAPIGQSPGQAHLSTHGQGTAAPPPSQLTHRHAPDQRCATTEGRRSAPS